MPRRCFNRGSRRRLSPLAGAAVFIVLGQPARAADKFQVYSAGSTAVGQLTIQRDFDYVAHIKGTSGLHRDLKKPHPRR